MNDNKPITTTETTLRLLIRDEVASLIETHSETCPYRSDDTAKRLRTVETRLSTLIGLMIGSGLLGGTAGAFISAGLK